MKLRNYVSHVGIYQGLSTMMTQWQIFLSAKCHHSHKSVVYFEIGLIKVNKMVQRFNKKIVHDCENFLPAVA